MKGEMLENVASQTQTHVSNVH